MDQTNNVRPKQIAFQITDPDKFALAKRLSREINKRSVKEPKKNCKHCYGRGFVGYKNGLKSLPVPCRCVFVKPIMGIRKYV